MPVVVPPGTALFAFTRRMTQDPTATTRIVPTRAPMTPPQSPVEDVLVPSPRRSCHLHAALDLIYAATSVEFVQERERRREDCRKNCDGNPACPLPLSRLAEPQQRGLT